MLICWLLGHRYDFHIKKPELLALACTRCGTMRILQDARVESARSVPIEINPDVPAH